MKGVHVTLTCVSILETLCWAMTLNNLFTWILQSHYLFCLLSPQVFISCITVRIMCKLTDMMSGSVSIYNHEYHTQKHSWIYGILFACVRAEICSRQNVRNCVIKLRRRNGWKCRKILIHNLWVNLNAPCKEGSQSSETKVTCYVVQNTKIFSFYSSEIFLKYANIYK